MSVRIVSTDRIASTISSTQSTSSTRLVCPVLVGREQELAQLRQAIQRPPAIVTIEGEAGVGKTRLVQQLLAEPALAGTARLVGQCSPLREPFPFGPVIDALAGARRWLPAGELPAVTAALRPLLPELADRLPPPLPALDNRRQERHRLFRGLRELLTCLGPAVLVLEDLHWIDPGTEELLRFLADRPPLGLSLVLTYRREDLADPNAPGVAPPISRAAAQLRLVLPPLTSDEVAALVTAVHQRPVPAQFSQQLYERTMGLPLAVEETLGLLWDGYPRQPGQELAPDQEHLPPDRPLVVPATLRDALLSRVHRLGGTARRLLHAAAVLNHPASEPVLQRLAERSEAQCTAGLAELVDRGLLLPVGQDRYGFRHRLVQQVIHDSLSEPARRALHRRAVQALSTEDPPPLAQLAHHSRSGGMLPQWRRYAEAAADQALRLGDDETAIALLRQVVSEPGATTRTQVRIAIKLGHAALAGLSHCAALALLQDTLAQAELPTAVRGELRLCLGLLLRNQLQQAEPGWRELTQAVSELADRPGPAARAMASLGAPYLTDGHHLDEHLTWLTRAEQTAARCGDPELQDAVAVNLATARWSTADAESWRPADTSGKDLVGDNPRMAVNAAWSAVTTGRYQVAEELLQIAPTLIDNPAGSYLSCALAGTTLLYDYAVGNWEGLAARAEQVASEHAHVTSVVAEARLVRGLLALAGGRLREAAEQIPIDIGSVPVAVTARAARARLAIAGDDLTEGQRWVWEALALVRGKGVWCWAAELLPIAVPVLARSPDPADEVATLLAEAEQGLAGRDSPLADAALLAAHACGAEAAGALSDAAAGHAEAARAYEALPYPYAAAQAWEAHGRCLLAAGRDGVTVLADVANRYATLGATFDVARCRHLLRSLGGQAPHRRGRRGYGGQLSPREWEVVRLVRSGLTNREVAAALFLSPRTVEAHVARVLRKLGLPSRRALASGDIAFGNGNPL